MKLYIKKIDNYDIDKIVSFLEESMESLWQKIEDKKTILVKPNLLGAYSPERGVTTHPAVLEALLIILKKKDKIVWIGDSPGGTVSIKQVYEKTGMKAVAGKYGAKILEFDLTGVKKVKTKDYEFYLTNALFEADATINVCKYKTHGMMLYTGAVKNLYGLIPGLKKADYHRDNPRPKVFANVLSQLYGCVREQIVFNILDGIIGMEGEGPSAGNPKHFGIMMASESATALDFHASRMLGFKINQLLYLKQAMEYDDLINEDIEIEERWTRYIFKDADINKALIKHRILESFPPFLEKLLRKLFDFYPAFTSSCVKCGVCEKSCPVNAILIRKDSSLPKIDYDKCIYCLCCHELCPHNAVYIEKSILARLFIK